MHTLIENVHVVEAIAPQAGGSELAGDWLNLKNCASVAILAHIKLAPNATPEVIPVTLSLEQAKDVSGTGAKALAKDVPIHLVNDAAAGDQWVRQDDGVNFTTDNTESHKLVMFEVPASALDVDGDFRCLRVKAAASDNANTISAVYLAHGLRYGGKSMITD